MLSALASWAYDLTPIKETAGKGGTSFRVLLPLRIGGLTMSRRKEFQMTNQPNPNDPSDKKDSGNTYSISIGGNIGAGASIGFGSVTADQIAGNDIIVNGMNIDNEGQRLSELITELKDLLNKAHQAGELPEDKAREVISTLEQAQELVEKEKVPPKGTLMQKFQRVMEVIDDVLDSMNDSKHPAALLIKALPLAAVLIKIASQLIP
jgi:hypothetical protein